MGKQVRTKEQRRAELDEAMERLDRGVREVFESGRWERYLEVMSRFHQYSANNSLLIAMQMPNATAVASYTDWKRKFGRQVRKGERGIRILAPVRYRRKVEDEDGDEAVVERLAGFRLASTFDVSQTDGEPLPQIAELLDGSVERYGQVMGAIEKAAHAIIEDIDAALGQAPPETATTSGRATRRSFPALASACCRSPRSPITMERHRGRELVAFPPSHSAASGRPPRPSGALGFSLDLRSVGGNPCARKGRENFSRCGSHDGEAKTRALAGFAFPLRAPGTPPPREPQGSPQGRAGRLGGHIMEATIYEMATKAIETFLDRRGYDIIERGWAHGSDRAEFIAREGGDLVFVTVKVSEGSGGFPEEGPADREGLERLAAAYLEHFGEGDATVRFDIVSMMVLGDSHGFLRLHRNALSAL